MYLAAVWTRFVNAFVEGCVGALQSVAGHASDYVGGIHQRFGGQQRQRAHGQHGLRAIDQRDRFFGFECERLDLRSLERIATRNARAFFVEALSFADQSEREMR